MNQTDQKTPWKGIAAYFVVAAFSVPAIMSVHEWGKERDIASIVSKMKEPQTVATTHVPAPTKQ